MTATPSAPAPAQMGEAGVILNPNLDAFLQEQGANTAGPEGRGMIAPGQEPILEAFLKEKGVADGTLPTDKEDAAAAPPAGEDGIPEKFRGKSAAEIAHAYQQLERRLGQPPPPEPQDSPPTPAALPDPTSYTPEKGKAEYGEQLAAAFAATEINPYQLWADAAAGKDVGEQTKALAAQLGLAESVVANYLDANAKVAAPAAPAATPEQPPAPTQGLTEADAAELKAMVGGDQAFQQLADWARANAAADLPAYQQAVESGNKPAVAAWLQAFKARQDAGVSVEPPLEGGGLPPGLDRFNSREEVFESMRKTNARGQRLYDVDSAYQRKHLAKLARSPDFR